MGGGLVGVAITQDGEVRTAKYGANVLSDEHAEMWTALLVLDASWLGLQPEDGGEQLWRFAPDGSWSMLDAGTGKVEQHGPRRLWDEVERAHGLWERTAKPTRDRLGLRRTERNASILAGRTQPCPVE